MNQPKALKFNFVVFFLFLICSILIIKNLGLTMPDDGWRHLAMAFYPDKIVSWERLYPFSLYNDFDPWFSWHYLLSFLINFMDKSTVPIFVNSIVYTLLSFWYYLAFKRFTEVSTIYTIIFSIGLPLLSFRYFFLRPDLLSGLFILYFLTLRNKKILFIIPLLYAPFYYVFWFYFGFIAYVTIILKDYYKTILIAVSLLFGFLFYSYFDLDGYLRITQFVLNNDLLTQSYSVGESKPFIIPLELKNSLGSTNLLLLLVFFSLTIYYVFKPKEILLKYVILFIPLFIIQQRFLNLLEPLFYIFLINLFYSSFKFIEKNGINNYIDRIKNYLKEKTFFLDFPKKFYFFISITIIIIFFIKTFDDYKKETKILEKTFLDMQFLKENEYKGKRILFSSIGTYGYMSTYLNPTASYIPSCSLGWVTYNQKDKEIYFDLLSNNEKITIEDFSSFLKKNSPDYFIIDTKKTSNLKFSDKSIKESGYKFYKIMNSKLIFRKF